MEVEEAVPLSGEAEEQGTLGAPAPHDAFVSPLLICLQGPVVCVILPDQTRWHKAVAPSFLFLQDNL